MTLKMHAREAKDVAPAAQAGEGSGEVPARALQKKRRNRKCLPLAQRFWPKVDKTPGQGPHGDCWLWTGTLSTNGYGQIRLSGRQTRAHRAAWTLEHGSIPDGACVLHRCDERRCVRIDHLFLGDKFDNMRDMAAKGRAHLQRRPDGLAGERHWTRKHPELTLRGEKNPAARLTEAQVLEIRERFADGATYRGLARAYQVTTNAIVQIVLGRKWKHVGGPISDTPRLGGRRGPRRAA